MDASQAQATWRGKIRISLILPGTSKIVLTFPVEGALGRPISTDIGARRTGNVREPGCQGQLRSYASPEKCTLYYH